MVEIFVMGDEDPSDGVVGRSGGWSRRLCGMNGCGEPGGKGGGVRCILGRAGGRGGRGELLGLGGFPRGLIVAFPGVYRHYGSY